MVPVRSSTAFVPIVVPCPNRPVRASSSGRADHLLLHLLRARCGARPAGSLSCTVDRMSAQAADHPDPDEPYEVIHLGGEAAAIVPLAELRRLRAVERHASPEALEEAEIEATLAAHDEWVAAGCPGARSHEDVMAELLGGDQ
jgi:hypothetical protein